MDQQNQNLSGAEPTAPRHVPTAEEIARAEAEAVAAMQLLLSRIEEPNLDYRIVHTETELIYRDSTRL